MTTPNLMPLFPSRGKTNSISSPSFHTWTYSHTRTNLLSHPIKKQKKHPPPNSNVTCDFTPLDDPILLTDILSPLYKTFHSCKRCWFSVSGTSYPQTCAAPPCRSITVVLSFFPSLSLSLSRYRLRLFVPLNISATWSCCTFLHSWFLLCAAQASCSGVLGHALSQEPVGPHPSFALHFHVSSQLQLEAVELLQHWSRRLWYMDF